MSDRRIGWIWAGLKAGYRFFDNPKVTPAAFLAPHQASTWERWAGQAMVLIAQDTTYFNFTRHPATTDLGPIGSGPEQGFLLHSALALTTDGVPLGLVAEIPWARDLEAPDKSADRKKLPIEVKESYRWLQAQAAITANVPEATQTVLMGDRESDTYDLFIAPREPGQHLLTYQVRRDPDQDPSVAFSPTQIEVLERMVATQNPPRSTPDLAGRGARDGQTRRISGPEA